MLEVSQPSPEERMEGYKKAGKEAVAKTSKRKSKEMEADFDARIAGWQEENKRAAEAMKQEADRKKYKEIMTELKGKLKNRKEEKSKEKAPEDDYESYEVSGREAVTKTSEQGPVASGEINTSQQLGKRVTNKNVIRRTPNEAANEAAKMKAFESNQQRAKESRAGEAQVDYVKAYKEYDPRFTKNKSDDQIARTKPPFFAFGKAARELKRLYGVMVRAEDSRVGGLSPEARRAIALSAKKEEEEFIESNKHLAPGEEEAEDR